MKEKFEIKYEKSNKKYVKDMKEDEFVKHYINIIRHHISIYVHVKDNREDLAQDCIIQLLKNKDKIKGCIEDDRMMIDSYIRTTVKHTIINKTKYKNSRYSNITFNQDEDNVVIHEDDEINDSIFDKIRDVLDNDELEIVIYLYNEYTQEKIANIYSITQPTVAYKISKIRKKLIENGIKY